jgi:flagellar hook-associated protein 2
MVLMEMGTMKRRGTNAEIYLKRLEPPTRKNNEFTINGTTFTLQGTTDVETTVNVMHDGDAVFQSIKSFIEKYNEIIDKINTKLTEQRYRDYPPLTNEQKKEMSEDEIKLWEEKAKSGTLRSDSLLRSVLDKMRFAWSSPVKAADSKLDQMTEYGIETGSYFEGGKLYIKDEARLKQAINENPDEVLKFFTNSSQNFEEQGVAQRLYNILSDSMASITPRRVVRAAFLNMIRAFWLKELGILKKELMPGKFD